MSRSESSDQSSSGADDFSPVEEFVDAAALAEGFYFKYDPLASSDSDSLIQTDGIQTVTGAAAMQVTALKTTGPTH